jgi:transcriptional regulator with XRE-family HTH domain
MAIEGTINNKQSIYVDEVTQRTVIFINAYIRQERISGSGFCELTGMSKFTLSKLRNGNTNATVKMLKMIADLGANMNWILSGDKFGSMFMEN